MSKCIISKIYKFFFFLNFKDIFKCIISKKYHLKYISKCIVLKCIVSPAAARASLPHSVQETSELAQKMPPAKNYVKNAP